MFFSGIYSAGLTTISCRKPGSIKRVTSNDSEGFINLYEIDFLKINTSTHELSGLRSILNSRDGAGCFLLVHLTAAERGDQVKFAILLGT